MEKKSRSQLHIKIAFEVILMHVKSVYVNKILSYRKKMQKYKFITRIA